jgi:hypothetical protein
VIESKKVLEKIKMKYYDSCKVVLEQEKNVCKTFSGKIINSDEDVTLAHDMLLKHRSQADNLAQIYKYELTKYNKILEESEKNYLEIWEKLKTNEESRIFFVKCTMEKFSKIYEEFAMSSFDFLNVNCF